MCFVQHTSHMKGHHKALVWCETVVLKKVPHRLPKLHVGCLGKQILGCVYNISAQYSTIFYAFKPESNGL